MTNEHTSLEKYTSHTLFENFCERVTRGLCLRGKLRDWINCNILTSSSFVFSSTSFSFYKAAQSGIPMAHSPLLGAGSLYSILSPTRLPPTDWTSCRTGLYHCLTFTCFLWRGICSRFNLSTVKVISWYPRPEAPVPWLTAGSKVNILHTFLWLHTNWKGSYFLQIHHISQVGGFILISFKKKRVRNRYLLTSLSVRRGEINKSVVWWKEYIYILLSITDILFRCITTHQCE